ncbi:MAG TPA: arylsulfatase [Verrucomicrobiae bacterium]
MPRGQIAAAENHGRRPDILFLVADDLGRADVGFAGGHAIQTPHLDALAAAGARLDQFYVQPLCSPTRAALMTGRYPMRYGLQVGVIRPHAKYGLPLEERVLPQALREAGYTTCMVGKWHLGSFDKAYWPTARGFDHHYGHLFGAIDYFKHTRDALPDWYRDGVALQEEGYTTHLLAREAVRIIQAQAGDKPLFLYVPFNAVHSPHQVPDKYKAPYAALPEPRRTYAGMVAALDETVGQIVAALDASARRTNTLIIFTSDNGGLRPGRVADNGPLRAGKGTLYEGGVRVCAFANWPGRIAPGVIREPFHIIDWYPTLLKLAGASIAQKLPLDGRDLWPALTASAPSPHTEILLNATPANGAIRVGDWKLIVNGSLIDDGTILKETAPDEPPKSGRATARRRIVELFHLRDDPGEQHNLAAREPEKARELQTRYDALAGQAVAPKNGAKP